MMNRPNLNTKAFAIALSMAGLCLAMPVSAQTNSPADGTIAPGTTVPDSGTSGVATDETDSDDGFDLGWLGLLGLAGLAGLRRPQEQRRSDTYVDPSTSTTTRSDYNR
ncbi:MAG: WGxxGxxG-CTERM domain-containing protein [Drouetiella hepatica Uher 2000/2452]|uniref:WGxxGxxG-CTERM domain-containing protein n=1 Tax=Drouetiella hepatica Uher 2000/2452 TaxID=904376 RepID=A0A951UMZ0_9CYAN|nr:WGxxGxxG-CTERM domain-containing protein [Drouetiella hepatica Uher 2000/2452]